MAVRGSESFPARIMNPGVTALMRFAQFGSRAARSEAQRAEMRGVTGALNVEFTGVDGGAWHMNFQDGAISMAAGLAAAPRATVRISTEDFMALVAGDQTMSVARMTGKIRAKGDGGFGIIFGGLVGSLQNAQRVPGWRGSLARLFIRRALRKGRYVPRATQRPS